MKEIDIGIFALHPLAHTPAFGSWAPPRNVFAGDKRTA